MAHHFAFTVRVTVERTEGKFAARDEIADALRDELEGAQPSEIYGLGADGASTYEVTDFEVEDAE